MRFTRAIRGALCVVWSLIFLLAPASSPAQDLVVARVESLNNFFDGAEAIAGAVGQPVGREMVLGMGAQVFGTHPNTFLAMDRPVAAVMPAEGMMMMQNGVVVAVPVTDTAAAINALASLFADHAVEGELHTFSGGPGPALYLTATEGYIKVGGDAGLVTKLDPLAGGPTGSTVSVELFLEPIGPMIEANLDKAKAQLRASLESEAAGDAEIPYDPATVGSMLDGYFDGFRWVMANTSSVRLRLDVDDGYVRFAKDLLPKPGGDLAGFIKAQKGGLPEIAKLADERSAWYMAGRITLTDEHRQGLKKFVDGYIDLMDSMFTSPAEPATSSDTAQLEAMAVWTELMAVMGPYAGRWIECLRGDMVASFDLPEGQPFQFVEAFGMVDGDECADLVSEMSDELVKAVGSTEEMSDTFTVARGPKIAGSESLVMTFDMAKMLDEMGQATDEHAEAVLKTMYGEEFSAAMVTAGDIVLATGGANAVDRLGKLAADLPAPGKAPSFSPLEVRPGLMFGMNLGAMLTWVKNAVPEGAADLEGAAERLSGDAGRVPMALTFGSEIATFETAVSLETIEVVAGIAQEQQAKRADAAEDEVTE